MWFSSKIKEAILVAQYLEKYGCVAIEVSCGIGEEGSYTIRGDLPFDMLVRRNDVMTKIPKVLHPIVKKTLKVVMGSPKPIYLYNLQSAQEIKRNVNIPIIVVGGIRKLDEIKGVIENDQCDYVSMSRPLIIEPNLVHKFKEGIQEQSKCIDCNYCIIGELTQPLKCYYGKI